VKLDWSELARSDLLASFHYIANDSVAAGAKVYAAIEAKAEQLIDFPEIGRAGRVEGTRELVVTGLPYIIAYAIQGDTVFILRVLHGAQQWPDDLPQ
jgi:toxin ParE1/3/4